MANKANTGKTETLLVELLTEELPPKSLHRLGETFAEQLVAEIIKHRLKDRVPTKQVFATPRRLAVLIEEVRRTALESGHRIEGPISSNAKAVEGFAKKHGVTPESLEKVATEKGEIVVANYTLPGVELDAVLGKMVEGVLKKLPVPKTMRWGEGDAQFVRPVHGLIMMHGARVVPGEVFGLKSGNQTLGHRFLSSGRITVRNARDYEQVLAKGKVAAGYETRKADIVNKINRICGNSVVPVAGDALYDEIAALVEAPTVYEGTFSAEFLEVPQECLILSMQQHQKYVPLRDKATGKLLPRFLFVSNITAKDSREIVHGNERVLRARLADAKFFYDQDRKTRLEARVPLLAKVVYHNKLGSQLERIERIKLLAGNIAREIGADPLLAERAAWLSKADLLTEMVGEFPELQGTMGRYYALHDGEPKEVADAIEQHYRPRFAKDRLPASPIARAVALADKLESLNSMFSVGGAPTGEKDPFGLRRAALGVLNILVEAKLPLELSAYARGEVHAFMMERLKNLLREQGYATDEVEAVVSQSPSRIDLVPVRLAGVKAFRRLPESESLAAANKRIRNILRKSEAADGSLDEALLGEAAERTLFDSMCKLEPEIAGRMQRGDYTGTLSAMAALRGPVDAFFDKVLVNAEDARLRANRHALLKRLDVLMNQVADISKLAQ